MARETTTSLADHRTVPLWPAGHVPEALGVAEVDLPALTVHPADQPNGAAVIVNPGGGYRILASDHEGIQVARQLNRMGITAFVLRYRVGPTYGVGVSLLDAQRAVRWVRAGADEYGVDPDRIGMLGFSAGGHLAAMAGTTFDEGMAASSDRVDRVGCRPDFLVLCYPAIDGGLFQDGAAFPATQIGVDATTPPTFLMHTHEDDVVISEHSLRFYQALRAARVPAELHVFGFGGHGLGLGTGDLALNQWPSLLQRWLKGCGFFTGARRVAVNGRVRVDGAAVGMGWVTFIPEDPNAPDARARLSRGTEGQFAIDALHGAVAGPHKVMIHHESDRFPLDANGAYTMIDPVRMTLELDVVEGQFLDLEVTA